MNTGRTAGACRGTTEWLCSASRSITRLAWPFLAIAALLCLVAGTAFYPFSAPEEARHAGIAHGMWAGRQYLMPKVNGFPVLDGAPLYYWLSVGLLSLFGNHEWVLRLPSALAGTALLVFLGRIFLPSSQWALSGTLAALFLLQPALMLAGRFASPDMLVLLLLTIVLGSFLRAVQCLEQERPSTSWLFVAWSTTALLGLASGPLSILVPPLAMALWLALRRRFDLLFALWWWPGVLTLALVFLPWLILVETRYPGILTAMLRKQMLALVSAEWHGCVALAAEACWLLILAASLPLLVCLYRFHDASRRAALRTPVAGLMALWLLLLVPLHPMMLMSPLGHTVALVVPLLYFGSLVMVPVGNTSAWAEIRAWLLVALLAAGVATAGVQLLAQRLSTTSSLTQGISPHFNPLTDKAIMLDRFDYDFSFYMRSPKLVYVASTWEQEAGTVTSRWKQDLSGSARFVPETAARLLLTADSAAIAGAHGAPARPLPVAPSAVPAAAGLLDRLCESRMVNLWIIGAADAPERYPILDELESIVATGQTSAWYLGAGREPRQCAEWVLQR